MKNEKYKNIHIPLRFNFNLGKGLSWKIANRNVTESQSEQ